ncbi:hypothetical protein D187_008505 [Cystobacter fuscus DSM 2262]|uniref:Uncharacterized protein n=1 Tax=Cystobacter fuscus (strain ATCC 25194 / DSM 2262 / NBRC 100088 / M29) TaxID=1242864 RepID=S9R081_CYSF2|nr:hypothetical protein D187_008505 [Cystobacter fuscus DSM 2262]
MSTDALRATRGLCLGHVHLLPSRPSRAARAREGVKELEQERHAAGRRREESRPGNPPDSTAPPPLEMPRRRPDTARVAPSMPAAWRHGPTASGSS